MDFDYDSDDDLPDNPPSPPLPDQAPSSPSRGGAASEKKQPTSSSPRPRPPPLQPLPQASGPAQASGPQPAPQPKHFLAAGAQDAIAAWWHKRLRQHELAAPVLSEIENFRTAGEAVSYLRRHLEHKPSLESICLCLSAIAKCAAPNTRLEYSNHRVVKEACVMVINFLRADSKVIQQDSAVAITEMVEGGASSSAGSRGGGGQQLMLQDGAAASSSSAVVLVGTTTTAPGAKPKGTSSTTTSSKKIVNINGHPDILAILECFYSLFVLEMSEQILDEVRRMARQVDLRGLVTGKVVGAFLREALQKKDFSEARSPRGEVGVVLQPESPKRVMSGSPIEEEEDSQEEGAVDEEEDKAAKKQTRGGSSSGREKSGAPPTTSVGGTGSSSVGGAGCSSAS